MLTTSEKEHWLGAYIASMEAMAKAGVLKSSHGLQPTSTATTVRVANGKAQVLDGPYADSKEQLGGFHIIEVADLDAALSWAAGSPHRDSRCRRGASDLGQELEGDSCGAREHARVSRR